MYHERALLWSQESCCVREVDEHYQPPVAVSIRPRFPACDCTDAPKNATTPTTTVAIPSIIYHPSST